MNNALLLTAPIGRTIAKLSAPNILAMFVMLLTSMAETWYVGQLGTTALAGLALVYPMFMLMGMLSAGAIGGAVAGAVAQALGAGDRERAEVLTLHSFVIALGGAVLFAAIFVGGGRWIFGLVGGEGAVLDQALRYSNILFLGMFAFWLANILSSVIRGCGNMLFSAATLILGSVLQILLGAVLVFGLGPFPALGIAGASAAAVISFALSSLLQIGFLMSGRGVIRLRFRGIGLKAAYFADLLKVGLLASISPVTSVATVIVITAFVARISEAALAGYGIGARLEFLIIPVVFGIGSALITLIGVHFGAGEIDRGHRIAWTGAFGAAAISGTIGILLALFPGLWANLFSDSAEVREACATYLRIVGPTYAFFGFGLCLFFASQGARRLFWPVIAGLLRLAVVIVGGALVVLWLGATMERLFLLIAIGMLVYALFIAVSIRLGAWRA